jgi:hypothetical protein
MNRLRIPILTMLAMAAANGAWAQTTQRVLTYTGHSGVVSTESFGGSRFYVGPYHGSAPGMGSFDMYCVDFFNRVHDARPDLAGVNWNANFTRISDLASGGLAYTRLGSAGSLDPDAMVRYQRAAFLTTKFWDYQASPDKAAKWSAIHSAIWQTAGGDLGSVPNWIGSSAFVDAASAFDPSTMDWSYWQVVTPVNADGSLGNNQEFLVFVTPEPSTILLMGSGLLALVGAAVVTRRFV